MTDRKQALTELLAKVEAGEWCTRVALKALPESHVNSTNDWVDAIGWASRAFHNGSMDAAKALHDAVLPGWRYSITLGPSGSVAVVAELLGVDVDTMGTTIDDPARAWLIAILKALISQEDAQ